jgi:hypothetical protein
MCNVAMLPRDGVGVKRNPIDYAFPPSVGPAATERSDLTFE